MAHEHHCTLRTAFTYHPLLRCVLPQHIYYHNTFSRTEGRERTHTVLLEVGCPTTTGLERLRVEKICGDNTPGLRETVALRMCAAQRMCPAKRIAVCMIFPLAGMFLYQKMQQFHFSFFAEAGIHKLHQMKE